MFDYIYLRFTTIFRSEAADLIRKVILQLDNRLVDLLHHYSTGSPFYLVQLLRRLNLRVYSTWRRSWSNRTGNIRRVGIKLNLMAGCEIYVV
jgi:hypothetical protein